jgi:hypothetical protein
MSGPKAMGTVVSEVSPDKLTAVNPLTAVGAFKAFIFLKNHFDFI